MGSLLGAVGCQPSGGTNSPNILEQTAGDIESEVDNAGQTAEGVGDDVGGAVDGVVEGDDGSTPPPAVGDDAASEDAG
ncbi:MAG: hypothetical protein K0V04_28540 [Deltaproteobacteria bacterium]|nr:hypothetical protein [Deltaproteobacteria bacterium]